MADEQVVASSLRGAADQPPSSSEKGLVPPLLIFLAGVIAGPWTHPRLPWLAWVRNLDGGRLLAACVQHQQQLLVASIVLFLIAVFLHAALGWGRRLSTLIAGLLTLHLGLHWLAWIVVSVPWLHHLFQQFQF